MSCEIGNTVDATYLTYFFLPALVEYHWGNNLLYKSEDDEFSIKADMFLLNHIKRKGYTVLQSGSVVEGLATLSYKEVSKRQHIVQLERDFDLMLINQ